jgi:nucleoside-diphosphate-sugar epimerase
MRETALVTGGAGFIGGHLVEHLLAGGWHVRVLDNFSSGKHENLPLGEVELITGDIRDPETCRRACYGVDSVFHLAAIASVASSVADPVQSHEVNVNGLLTMLMAARDEDVRRFVLSSSASVYGDADEVPTPETAAIRPQSPYATGKACGEMYCRNFWELYGLETVILRYFNVFGPRQSPVSGYAAVIPQFVNAAIHRQRPIVYGDGKQTRDFVYVGNVAAANVRAATADGVAGMTFNVAAGEGINLLQLLEELRRLSGSPLIPEFRAPRAGEVRHSRADVSRSREVLGFTPDVSLRAGLRATLEAAVTAAPAAAPTLSAA